MKVLIVGLIVLALGVAGVSTYLIKSFSSEEAIEELKEEAAPIKTKVLVAAKSVKAGEPVTADALRWQEWPQEILVDKYVVSEDEKQQDKILEKHAGNIARFAITEGEPILPAKLFSRKKAGFMAGMLTPGMRAITIRVTPNSAVGGFILPNDRVDVLIVHDKLNKIIGDKEKEAERLKDEEGNNQDAELQRPPNVEDPPKEPAPNTDQIPGVVDVPELNSLADLEKVRKNPSWFLHKNLGPFIFVTRTTETILRDVRVIAINEAVSPPEGKAVKANTATLEVTPVQAEIITEAQAIGKLSLVLRGIGAEDTEQTVLRATTDVEVSPLLGKFKKDFEEFNQQLAKLRAEQAAEMERQREAEEAAAEFDERMRLQRQMQRESKVIAPIPEKPAKPAKAKPKPKPKKPTLKIYRGGAAKTEEIQTK